MDVGSSRRYETIETTRRAVVHVRAYPNVEIINSFTQVRQVSRTK